MTTVGSPPRQEPKHTLLARGAVALALAAAVLVGLGMSGLGGGGAGAVLSFAAFVAAVAVRVKHERWSLLWLPLLLFPALLVFAPFWI